MTQKDLNELANVLNSVAWRQRGSGPTIHISSHPKTIIAGNGIYARCRDCGKLVKLNKWLVGDLHFCAEDTGENQEKK